MTEVYDGSNRLNEDNNRIRPSHPPFASALCIRPLHPPFASALRIRPTLPGGQGVEPPQYAGTWP